MESFRECHAQDAGHSRVVKEEPLEAVAGRESGGASHGKGSRGSLTRARTERFWAEGGMRGSLLSQSGFPAG